MTYLKNAFWLFVLLLLVSPVQAEKPTNSDDNFGKYYAIIIGINDYKGSTWQPLGSALNDAQSVENVLKQRYKFDEILTLYDKEATRINILQDIASFSKKMTKNDNLLIYFSGHGIEISGEGYWVPVDARTDGIYGLVSNGDIRTMLTTSKSKHTLVIIDACFSSTIFRIATPLEKPFVNNGSEDYYQKIDNLVSRQAITSGGLEPVLDVRGNICGGKHSVFACYLLKYLEENQEPYMEVAELFQKLKFPASRNATMPKFGYISGLGDEGGQFIFKLKKQGEGRSDNTENKKPDVNTQNRTKSYGIATGSKSGTYIVFGNDIKRVAKKDLKFNVIETKGSLDNFNKLLDGDAGVQFAIVQYDVLQHEDKSGFFRKNKSKDIKMVFPLYDEEIHILARKGSDINTFADLMDKKVVVGVENSGTWISMSNLQRKTKMRWNSVAKGFDDGLKDLIAGKADALVYVAGSPTKKLGRLSEGASSFIKLIPIPVNAELSKIYTPTTIKANVYDWIEEDVQTYSIKSILVSYNSQKGTKEYKAINKLVKIILTNLDDLKSLGHPKWKEVCPTDYAKVPWDIHPASKNAIDAWKEMFGGCE